MARLTHTINPGYATRGHGRNKEVQAVCGAWLDDDVMSDGDPTCPSCKAQNDDDEETTRGLDALIEQQQKASYAAHLARVQAHRDRQQQGGAR
jgi:hypothetical protein